MSRKKWLQKDYGRKISSGRLKSRLVLILRRNGFSVFLETDRKKSYFLSINPQYIGLGLSNLEVLTSCHNLEMDNFDDYIS